MISILFDTNIYDFFATDNRTLESIKILIFIEKIKVIVTRTIAEELYRSPIQGVPNLFPIEHIGNTVSRVGIMCAGDSLGAGDVFYEHLGQSTKMNDALITDAASWHANWLVSEDIRLRNRANTITARLTPMSYIEFVRELQTLLAKTQSTTQSFTRINMRQQGIT